MTTQDAKHMLQVARAILITTQPFWGSLSLRVTLEECREIETADIDGVTLRFNPEFIAGLKPVERIALVGHEIGHAALGHCWRQGARDPQRWNQACDYVINPILKDAGFTLGADWLIDPQYAGMSVEEVYGLLPPSPPGGGKGKGGNNPGGTRPAPSAPGGSKPDSSQQQALESDWKLHVTQAANIAKAAGKLPGALEKLVAEIKQPKVDWRSELRRFFSVAAANDYRMLPPNRRYLSSGLILPSIKSERLGTVAFWADTSGSMAEAMARVCAEMNSILDEAQPERFIFGQCDARVQSVEEFIPDDYPVTFKAKGFGGTDFRPPFAWHEKQDEQPACLIYLTDMAGTFPLRDPGYPVLWASTTRGQEGPFGETVYIDPEM